MTNEQAPHKLYHHFAELPYSLRVLYTCVLLILGLGYLFALLNVYFTYAGRAGGNPIMLSYEDIVVAYTGSGKGSKLESALNGPMSTMLPPNERTDVVNWIHEGVAKEGYDSTVKPIVAKRCLTCHGGSNPHLPNFSDYDNLKKVTELDTGASIATLVRVSHIHLFGLTFIFFIVGHIFSHAYLRPVWLKCLIVAAPFACITLDVSSWYIIKLFHPFAFAVIGAGASMATCFAAMWVTSMYQLWFAKAPDAIQSRLGGDIPVS